MCHRSVSYDSDLLLTGAQQAVPNWSGCSRRTVHKMVIVQDFFVLLKNSSFSKKIYCCHSPSLQGLRCKTKPQSEYVFSCMCSWRKLENGIEVECTSVFNDVELVQCCCWWGSRTALQKHEMFACCSKCTQQSSTSSVWFGSFLGSVVPPAVSKPKWRPHHLLCFSQHQRHYRDEVRGEAKVLTQPQNQFWFTAYRFVLIKTICWLGFRMRNWFWMSLLPHSALKEQRS